MRQEQASEQEVVAAQRSMRRCFPPEAGNEGHAHHDFLRDAELLDVPYEPQAEGEAAVQGGTDAS